VIRRHPFAPGSLITPCKKKTLRAQHFSAGHQLLPITSENEFETRLIPALKYRPHMMMCIARMSDRSGFVYM